MYIYIDVVGITTSDFVCIRPHQCRVVTNDTIAVITATNIIINTICFVKDNVCSYSQGSMLSGLKL